MNSRVESDTMCFGEGVNLYSIMVKTALNANCVCYREGADLSLEALMEVAQDKRQREEDLIMEDWMKMMLKNQIRECLTADDYGHLTSHHSSEFFFFLKI